jgi:hypothetical protein
MKVISEVKKTIFLAESKMLNNAMFDGVCMVLER